MQTLSNYDVIKQLDKLFYKAEVKYEALFINQDIDVSNFPQLKKDWEESLVNSPLLDVSTYLVKLYKTNGLKDEIDNSLIEGKDSYFQYANNMITNRFNFITSYFKSAIFFYFKNAARTADLIAKLNDKQDLTKDDFLLAVQLDYIEKFQLLEMVYHKYYTQYSPLLVDNDNNVQEQAFDPIQLNYGENNNLVIKALYQCLINKHIDVDFLTFEAHFKVQNKSLSPILWKSSKVMLCVLFNGVDLNDGYKTSLTGIRTKNANNCKFICNHFLDKHGNKLVEETIRSTINKLTLGKPNGLESISELLQTIEKSYATL